jgi:hypothetical protein
MTDSDFLVMLDPDSPYIEYAVRNPDPNTAGETK